MTVDVFFSPDVVDEASVEGKTAVVIDVIRATSTLVEALANGARAIFPTISTEEAVKLASSLGREDTLLCGERKGLKVEGFDLGNSPAEFTAEVVQGKQLVMTTTNGTRAFFAAEGADRVLAASFMNLSAVAGALDKVAGLVIVCSGRENRFSLDDALCAGVLVQTLEKGLEEELELNDAGRVVRDLASKYHGGCGLPSVHRRWEGSGQGWVGGRPGSLRLPRSLLTGSRNARAENQHSPATG